MYIIPTVKLKNSKESRLYYDAYWCVYQLFTLILGVNFLFCKDLLLSESYSWNYSFGEGNGTYKFAERS